MKLQAGAKEIVPRNIKTGNWREMAVDAKLVNRGITWYRAQGGFGDGRGREREDWIADVPGICLSVCDYNWNGDSFGKDYPSFEAALEGEAKSALKFAHHTRAEKLRELQTLERGIARLENSVLDV